MLHGPLDAECEAAAFLASILQKNPLPEAPDETIEEQQGVYRVDSPTAKALHCIGLIRDGKIFSYIDLDQVPEPQTSGEKMHYMTFIAHTILGGLMDALLLMEERHRHQQGDNDEGETSHA